MKLSLEVLDLQKKMKIKSDMSNVRQRINGASLTTKIKYREAVLRNAVDNLIDSGVV